MLQKLIRKQMCLHREVMSTLKVALLDRVLGFLHERMDLIHHGLLVGVELAARTPLQIPVSRGQQLPGILALVRGLGPRHPGSKQSTSLGGSALPHNDLMPA